MRSSGFGASGRGPALGTALAIQIIRDILGGGGVSKKKLVTAGLNRSC